MKSTGNNDIHDIHSSFFCRLGVHTDLSCLRNITKLQWLYQQVFLMFLREIFGNFLQTFLITLKFSTREKFPVKVNFDVRLNLQKVQELVGVKTYSITLPQSVMEKKRRRLPYTYCMINHCIRVHSYEVLNQKRYISDSSLVICHVDYWH